MGEEEKEEGAGDYPDEGKEIVKGRRGSGARGGKQLIEEAEDEEEGDGEKEEVEIFLLGGVIF